MEQSPANSYGLSRLEIPQVGTYGWQVRVQRGGEKASRFFADGIHGGVKQSQIAAVNWRDAVVAAWNAQDKARTCKVSQRNASGVVGVSRIIVRTASGYEYYFWQATWCPSPGQRKTIRFSVRRHGDDIAYKLAIEARQRGIA